MGDTLWMDDEVRIWLAGLRASDPPLARATAEAVLALLDGGPWLGPPLLVPATEPRQGAPAVLAELDEAYDHMLEALTHARREVADVATARKRTEFDLGEQDGAGSRREADLRDRLTELTAAEDKLTAYSQRMQARVQDFRARKEMLKATYTAAQTRRRINEVYLKFGEELGEPTAPFPTADDTVGAITAEAAELLRTAAELDKELRRIRPRRGPRLRSRMVRPFRSGPGEPDEPVLLSLRPAAPGCLDVRILCASEPPGLAGAGNGHGARDEQRPADASGPDGQQSGGRGALLLLAASARHAGATAEPDPLLQQAEARYWAMLAADPLPVPGQNAAPGGPVAYDRAGFAREFLDGPGTAAPDAIAAAVAARARRHRLAELRARSGLTQAEVADRLGVRQERVSAMERGDVSAMEVRTAAAYVEALGGRLEITAEFGDRVILG